MIFFIFFSRTELDDIFDVCLEEGSKMSDQKLFLDMFQHSTFIHGYEEFVFINIPQDHSRNNLNFAMTIRHVCTMWDFRHM